MRRRVVVTGLGLITSLGRRVEAFWRRLLAGESGVSRVEAFDVSDYAVQVAGEVKDFDPTDYIPKREARHQDRFSQMAVAAAIGAVDDAGLDLERVEDPFRAGVIVGSGIGGLAELEQQHKRLLAKGPMRVSPFMIPKLMINAAASQISILYQIKGPNAGVANACSSANNAIGQAFWTITSDEADIMITGGSEAALTPMGLAGFCTNRALSTRNDDPAGASRPFDRDRDGFVLGEGAGIIVLEEYEHARARGARIYAEVIGFGMSGDGRRRPPVGQLHQRPRHGHAARRRGRGQGRQGGLRQPCGQGRRLEHQIEHRAPARGERRRRVHRHVPRHPRPGCPANHQPGASRPRVRPEPRGP